ncbi:MAG: hypothetical protein IT196_14995 [Acidimicrobiales bacterium]|nr:hypothetical protein [Acidimicrobiales bacterium]
MRSLVPGDVLAQVAELLGDAATSDSADAAVGVRLTEDGVELHLRTAPHGLHVAELLVGFDAPAEWDAIGVIAHGRAFPVASGRAAAQPVTVVHLQARSGAACSRYGPPGGAPQVDTFAEGRVAELCRRCVGLPNPPPLVSPLHWWAVAWLDELAATPAVELFRRERELVELFPGGEPFGAERTLSALEEHGRLLEHSCPWPCLRAAVAAGTIEMPGVAPDEAAWLDDGLFSRFAMGGLAHPAALFEELRERLQPELHGALGALLRRWRVLEGCEGCGACG